MKATSITFIFFISFFKLLAQPNLYPDMKLQDIDTVISPKRPADSIIYYPDLAGNYSFPYLRISKILDDIPLIVEYDMYVYHSRVDSVPVERGEGAFDENGNIISSSNYTWDPYAGDWTISGKRENYYDASGRDTTYLVYQHNPQDNSMVLVYMWSVKYNESDDVIFNKKYSYYMQSNTSVEATWEYNYNNQGSLLTANRYFKDSEMVDKFKISSLEQKYDEHNNRTSREMYSRDSDDMWIGMEKTEWDYDEEGREIRELAYDWEESEGVWDFSRKSEYSMNPSDQVKTETIYVFDIELNSWILSRQIDYDYDLRGNRISKSSSVFDPASEKWIKSYRFDYIFDDEGREISSIQYDWDDSLSIWIPLWNKRMSYDAINYLASFHWSIDHNDWVGDWKRETLYNTYGDYYLDAYYEWDIISSAWSVKSGVKWDRFYDMNDHEIEAIGYNWELDVVNWVPGGKFEWIYNEEQDLIRSADYAWNPGQQDWNLYSKTFYNYRKGFITGIPEKNPEKIIIYPNPAESFLRIDGIEDPVSIDIFSTTGHLVLRNVKPQTRIDISSLPNGMYIFVIRQAGNILISKKIVKH